MKILWHGEIGLFSSFHIDCRMRKYRFRVESCIIRVLTGPHRELGVYLFPLLVSGVKQTLLDAFGRRTSLASQPFPHNQDLSRHCVHALPI